MGFGDVLSGLQGFLGGEKQLAHPFRSCDVTHRCANGTAPSESSKR